MALENIKFLVLWVTGDCNLNCKYCYADGKTNKESMSFEIAKMAIDRCDKGPVKLQLAGGEPLLNLELIKEIYDYIKLNNIPAILQMQTNATLIDSKVARDIRDMNISMGVSFDGTIEINQYLRGKSPKVLSGIRHLKDEGIMVNLNCVVTNRNIEYLDQLVDMAYYLGNVGGVGLDLLRLTGRALENKLEIREATEKEIKYALKRAYLRTREIERISGRRIVLREIEEAKRRIEQPLRCGEYCHASYGGSAVVLPNGDIYPCGSLIGNEEYYMGNILNEDSIKDVQIATIAPPRCRICKYKDICQGACPASAIINNNGEIPDQDCVLRRTSFEIAEDYME